ncbi:MAG: GTP-binding protein [Thermodesulfobacteriota bacterium]
MVRKPALLFVGGFLGAGKTTAISSLARLFSKQGLATAAITNDQAEGLVDTYFLSGEGIPAKEVAGSCFCCNFDGLARAIDQSLAAATPDVILAEPVGSCTDIVATVIRPMRALLADKVVVKAYSVLVEPDRWREFHGNDSHAPWSMKFLFDKQLREADLIVLTKTDTLSLEECGSIQSDMSSSYPHAEVIAISARNGSNLTEWSDKARSADPQEHWLREIDYQRYAEAEAEMGWLNSEASVAFPKPVDATAFTAALIEGMRQGVAARGGHVGHLKVLAVGRSGSIKAGITGILGNAEMEGAFTGPVSELCLTVNVRATVSPGELAEIVTDSLARLSAHERAKSDISRLNTFRPAPPNPTHRYGAV